jgi:iron-sulfur cluster assembly protein
MQAGASDRNIKLTEVAKIKVAETLKSKNGTGLRIGVRGGGCSGFEYVCDVNRKSNSDDTVFFEGTDHQVFIDAKSMFFLTGLVVDYNDGLTGAGFTFENPNSTGTCGCGTSFAI